MRRLGVLAAHAADLGTDLLTLCTGTRNPDNMWRDHPQNSSPEAWSDLLTAMEQALAHAEGQNVRLGIEPEVSNVVSSPHKARDLLNTMRSDRLTIVMDGANGLSKRNDPPANVKSWMRPLTCWVTVSRWPTPKT